MSAMDNNPSAWRKRIDRSKRVRKPYLDDKELFLNLYTNDGSPHRASHRRDLMQVNYIYSHIRLVSPSIFAGSPRISVVPRLNLPGMDINAKNLEGVIHYWAKELGASEEFNSMLFDSFFSLAAIETGWDYRTQISEEAQPIIHPETGGLLLDPSTGMPAMQMQPVEKVLSDKPFIRWRDSKDIMLDIDVPRRKDGRFMVVRDVVTHDYFMNMSEIPQELRDKVKPTVRPEDSNRDGDLRDYRDKDTPSDMEWVELEWIWNRENMCRYLVTPTMPKEFLLEGDWPYDIKVENDPFPITIIDNITDNRWPYSWSEFRPAMEHIRELNRIRTNMAYHVKANQPKYLYAKGALTRAQASKWANARPDELIEAQNPDGIKQAPLAVFPAETLEWNNTVEQDLVKLTGLIEYEQSPQADTATEASIIEGRSQVRKRARSSVFEKAVCTALTKLGQLCQQFQNEAITVQIDGPEGQSWRQLTKEQIQGDFQYDVEPGIMEFKNKALEKQQTLKFAELMAQNPNVNQRWLAEEMAKVFEKNPAKCLLPLDQIKTAPPEPMIKFKPIDLLEIPNPQAQAELVHAALIQNQAIPNPQQAPMPPQGPPPDASMGAGPPQGMPGLIDPEMAQPHGGKTSLPPVEGNAGVQPMSEDY